MMQIFVFAGQGSQFYGMGIHLYRSSRAFRNTIDRLDNKIEKYINKSIRKEMLNTDKRGESFDHLTESSFAIFMFEYAAAVMMIDAGIKPDGVIGCSMGEMAAQVTAGVIDEDEAIWLICKQSALFENKLPRGGMLAVCENYAEFKDRGYLSGCELVSVNHDKNFVITGLRDDLECARQKLDKRKAITIPLPVNYSFHSSNMDFIKDDFCGLVSRLHIKRNPTKCRFFSCVTGREIHRIDSEYLWNVVRQPINWRQCVDNIKQETPIFLDLSADAELATMLKSILGPEQNIHRISSMFNTPVDLTDVIKNIRDQNKVRR